MRWRATRHLQTAPAGVRSAMRVQSIPSVGSFLKTARSDDKGHSTCWDHPLGSLGALNQHCRVPVSLQFFRASPLPHSCVSPLPHHRAAAPFHARADDDDDANDDDDYSVCPDVETECHSCPKHFQTSTSGMFYGRRRWDFPKQNGNTIWAPRVANKSHVRPAVEGRHWDSPNHAEGSIWAPRDDDESHVGPAVKGRHWDSTKTAVGSCSRKGTRPARRLSTDAVNLAQIPSSCRPALLGDSLLAQIRLPLLCSTGKSFPINEPQNLP